MIGNVSINHHLDFIDEKSLAFRGFGLWIRNGVYDHLFHQETDCLLGVGTVDLISDATQPGPHLIHRRLAIAGGLGLHRI